VTPSADRLQIVVATQNFPPDTGGIAALVGGLAEHLARKDAVHVFAHRIRGRNLAELEPHPFAGLRRFGALAPLRNWLKARAMRPLLGAPGLRGVVCDSWKSALALPSTAAPILVLAHGMEYPPAPSARRIRRIRAGLGKASVVVAVSRHTAALVAPYLEAGARVEVIPPAIPPQPPADAGARAALRTLAGSGPIIASLARLEPRKGIDRVIGALPALIARHPGLSYLVAGGGEDRVRLQALAEAAGVAARVHFLGQVDEARKAALLAEADIFAMPTRREGASVEGFGIVYLEAAWHGCPALAGRDGGAEDAVADGQTGLLCDGASQTSVTNALATLLEDHAGREAMGVAAAQRVRAGFLWEQILPRFDALLSPPRA
jgi:phosphatidylinositol alpha-1,6-mannosyltransferase